MKLPAVILAAATSGLSAIVSRVDQLEQWMRIGASAASIAAGCGTLVLIVIKIRKRKD